MSLDLQTKREITRSVRNYSYHGRPICLFGTPVSELPDTLDYLKRQVSSIHHVGIIISKSTIDCRYIHGVNHYFVDLLINLELPF